MAFKLHLICAIGNHGAIGLNNALPWHKPDDLRLFKQLTTNKNIIVGRRTAESLPVLPERTILVWHAIYHPADFLADLEKLGHKEAWLCGGSYTYATFAPYVNGNRVINMIDYDGPFDTTFPFAAYGMSGW